MDLYQAFAERAEKVQHFWEVKFQPDTIKVKDWFGWTDLVAIRKVDDVPANEWHNLLPVVDFSKMLTLTSFEVLPAYDSSEPTEGFHGERKHRYTLKLLRDITDQDLVRIRDVKKYPNEEFFVPDITSSTSAPRTGYTLVTKSEFYNANGFSVWAGITMGAKPTGCR